MDTSKNVLFVGLVLGLLLGVWGTDHLNQEVRTVCTTMPPFLLAYTLMKGATLSAIWLGAYGLWYLAVKWYWKRKDESPSLDR